MARAQDEYLGVLGQGVPPVVSDEPKQALDQLIEERQGHSRASWPTTSELVKAMMRVIGPFRCSDNCRQPSPAVTSIAAVRSWLLAAQSAPAHVATRDGSDGGPTLGSMRMSSMNDFVDLHEVNRKLDLSGPAQKRR